MNRIYTISSGDIDYISLVSQDIIKGKMNAIKVVTSRDFRSKPFTGELPNDVGISDIGVGYMDFLEQILEMAKESNCSYVIGDDGKDIPVMSKSYKEELRERLVDLESRRPMSDAVMTKIGRIRKQLSEEVESLQKVNGAAAKVLTIQRSISAPNVQQQQDQFTRPYGSSFFVAYQALHIAQSRLYFGKPYMKKDEATRRISAVGYAYTIPQLLMLLGQLEVIFKKTEEWLSTYDADGNVEISHLNFGEDEKNRFLTERISNSSALAKYRSMAEDSEDSPFMQLVANIREKVLAVVPFLDDVTSQGSKTVLAATIHDTQQLQQSAFQSGIEFGTQQADKKQRTEFFRPYASAQPNSRTSTLCHYWDGKSCDYETARHLPCKYVDSHIMGVSSFKGPYIVKNDNSHAASFEQYQQWMKGREQLPYK